LEPLIKEITFDAATTPVDAKTLKDFITLTTKETGIKIEYGNPILNKDNWLLDVLTKKECIKMLREELDKGRSLCEAVKSVNLKQIEVEGDQGADDRLTLFRQKLID